MQTTIRKTTCPKCNRTIAAAGLNQHLKDKHGENWLQGGLCLSRKVLERIIIDGGIVVTVLKASHGTARLHITAPDHVNIVREELTLETEGTK